MARQLFGTDGIRGIANQAPMTADAVLRLAQATGVQFLRGDHRHSVVIGKDTRLSGYLLEPALTAGFISIGMDVVLLGPLPTPAVAMLTRSLRADLGVMISASHNPHQDNGIKFFGPTGDKLPDDIEARIEARMREGTETYLAPAHALGRARRLEDAQGRYIEFVKSTFPRGLRLDGLKIVVDCAHGAAYKVAPRVLWELGAEVISIGVAPDGSNINEACGAAHPAAICAAVIEHGADFGIALDGDADRIVMADEKGHLLDGDQLMGLIAVAWQKEKRLERPGIVATIMSNMGLEKYLAGQGISLLRAQVGDRYVSAMMKEQGYNLGGEPSGHIILNDYMTTGDGLMAALQVLAVLVSDGRPASEVARVFTPYPQVMKNIRLPELKGVLERPIVAEAIHEIEQRLAGRGRLVVRKSGTEPLLRIMAEGEDLGELTQLTDRLAAIIAASA